MEKKRLNLQYSSSIEKITAVNSSFDKGIMRVFYFGKNRNNSFISKEALERSKNTLAYCPVVAHYSVEENAIGGHDMEVVHTEDGIRLVNVTEPVGVVPAEAKHWTEVVEDDSGSHEYFCTEVLLWKRQAAYKKIVEDGIVAQSMEITVNDGGMENGIYMINNFEFTALTLLNGEDDIPCFESAALEMFSMDDFKKQFSMMMDDVKRDMTDIQQSFSAVSEISSKGGNQVLNEKEVLLQEFGLTVESLDFSIEEYTVEELRAKFEAMKNGDSANSEPTSDDGAKDKEYSLTARQLTNELVTALSEVKVEGDGYCYSRYWYVDHDVEASEVYYEDCEDWNVYGAPFSMNGDNVVIDFASCKRKKCQYVDFDEGEQPEQMFSVKGAVDAVIAGINQKYEKQIAEKQAAFDTLTTEANELRKYKETRVAEDRKAAENEVFAQFEELAGVEEFESLREKCESYSLEDLENRCYAILGRQHKAKFSLSDAPATTKLAVEKVVESEPKPYGGVVEKYRKK